MSRVKADSAEEQLQRFIGKFELNHRAIIRAARKALRKCFPTANELVYDNYNFFVIGFGPSERPSDCFISIAAAANGVGLCFIHGATLPDPARILSGLGKQTRFVRPAFRRCACATGGSGSSQGRGRAGTRPSFRSRPGQAHHSIRLGQAAPTSQATKNLARRCRQFTYLRTRNANPYFK